MELNRRNFLILGLGFTAGCATSGPGGSATAPSGKERVVNAGPSDRYIRDGVYSEYRDRGFFIVRNGPRLFAISAICTHRRCKLESQPDRTFLCPCHDSTFNPDGKVTARPARRDLPIFESSIDDQGNLQVKVPAG